MDPATLALIAATLKTVMEWGINAVQAHEAGQDTDPEKIRAVAAQIAAACKAADQAWLDGEKKGS